MQSKTLRYNGQQSTVSYDVKRCIHAAECVKRLPAVFDPARKPWVDLDQASADQIEETVARCPTGALHVEDGPQELTPATPEIRICADGPLYVHGKITVKSMAGETLLEDSRAAFCRCGASQNKPLCDNMHQAAAFGDPGGIGSMPTAAATVDAGALTVTPAPDGPLLLDGPFTIQGADGSSVCATKGALCRCGASANKPFCDGSHGRIGFTG